MAVLRFCAYQYQNLPLGLLRRRWRDAERLGFDVLWNCDTLVEPDRARHAMFDGPTTLTLMAVGTTSIRVGTLVNSLYFRHPVTLTKAAMTLDHLSGGRLELALGVGDPSAGAAAVGLNRTVGERVAQFAEFVELVDLLLRQQVTHYQGRFYRCDGAETIPSPVQRPRPPITIAAHGPRMLRIAARYADGWSCWGGYGAQTDEDFHTITADRSRRFDDLCAEGVVVVKRGADGKLEVQKATDHSTKSGLKWGVVGGIVLGVIFPPSILGSAVVVGGAGAATGKLRQRHHRDELEQELEDAIAPGHSGILALVSDPGAVEIRKALDRADRIVQSAVDDVAAADIKAAAKEAESADGATGATAPDN